MNKLVLSYVVLILFPILFILNYTSRLNREIIIADSINEKLALTNNLSNTLNNHIAHIEGISNQVAYNSQMLHFLSTPFEMNQEELNNYTNAILPFMSNLRGLNKYAIDSISIYSTNETIPETWNYFLHASNITDFAWYGAFIESSEKEKWLIGDNLGSLGINVHERHTEYMAYIKKLFDTDGAYLGLLIIQITEKSFVDNILLWVKDEENIFLINKKERELVNAKSFDEDFGIDTFFRILESGREYRYDHDTIITFKELSNIDLILFYKSSIDQANEAFKHTMKIMRSIIIVSSILLILVIYYIVKKTVGDMNSIARTMIRAASGDLSASVETTRMDEVGQIGESYNVLISRINTLIDKVVEKEMAQKNAQLNALQYQINPHFIYNTLDIFRMKLEISGEVETGNAIATFGKLLRYNLKGRDQYTTLIEEINQVENYMDIQKFRLGDNIKWHCDIPSELANQKVVKLILQPIVENSIIHGYRGYGTCLTISIYIKRYDDRYDIYIEDDGNGIDPDKLQYINHEFKISKYDRMRDKIIDRGIGLTNVNLRIKIFYGNAYYIKVESQKGKGTKVIIPIQLEGELDV
ncbi:histidine kinase [Vallitalea pronyensis]|uniref:Histidine kinase n=1 Tax=Vallitalea pronyensis TaxID=1348613 RepID=A0A8J8SG76_9FIRM|nr:histidine kinase [Vallitalea pronyensis]QUI22301.1 histidine kinase [Vallitalea pronyensis]